MFETSGGPWPAVQLSHTPNYQYKNLYEPNFGNLLG